MRLYEFDRAATPVETNRYERAAIRPEETLESWIHANPGVVLGEQLLVVGRQVRLDAGVVDLLACDRFGNVVVCEVKIGRSGTGSASEETILGQPQAYASDVSRFDYDALEAIYREYRERLDDDRWSVDASIAPEATLREAFEATFGTDLDDSAYNTYQRMVVVAEEITRRTRRNARYLLQEGLNFQCAEVQWFVPPGTDAEVDRSALASSVVVDYDLDRVRPTRGESPTYPDLVREIVEDAFPSLGGLVRADAPLEVFPDGFDVRGPTLHSRHPAHPDGVVYGIAVKPDHGEVLLTIDNLEEDPTVPERIQSNRAAFVEAGFTVKDNLRYRLVEAKFQAETVEDVRDQLLEIAKLYETLVRVGHEVLIDAGEAGT